MSARVEIRTVAEVPVAIDAMMGFTPMESLVIVGLGAGPVARVDLSPEAVASLAPAVRHWGRVMIVVYSETPAAASYGAAFTEAYPTVDVVDVLEVRDGMVTSQHFGTTEPVAPIAPGILGDRLIADSRDDVVAEAERVTDPAEALRLAEAYYGAGDGARAWVYCDRARELGADPSAIEHRLTNADDPRSVA